MTGFNDIWTTWLNCIIYNTIKQAVDILNAIKCFLSRFYANFKSENSFALSGHIVKILPNKCFYFV